MKPAQLLKTFNDRYPFVGPTFWIVSVQYYLTQIIVALAWSTHYSWAQNTISDLGNTSCNTYAYRMVCSPLHGLMNASFITLGITMIGGSTLIYREFKKSTLSGIGFSFMGLSGIGTLLVGIFPENSINILHILGASAVFLIGNLGIALLGKTLDIPKSLRYYTLLSGLVALIASLLFVCHLYLGLGIGGMERLATYPQTMWLIVFGVYISSNHIQSNRLAVS